MSLLNVHIGSEQILVAVDSCSQVLETRRNTNTSKLATLPHLGAVVASRGLNVYFSSVFSLLLQAADIDSFDSLLARMPGVLRTAFSFLATNECALPSGVTRVEVDSQQILIAGYSAKRGRLLARMYEQADRDIGFVESDIDAPGYLAPWHSSWGALPSLDCASMLSVATLQTRLALSLMPGSAHGGKLLAVELTADRASFSVLGLLTEDQRRMRTIRFGRSGRNKPHSA